MAAQRTTWDLTADVVVVGSGSGALTCSLTAASRGASVILLERSSQVGGGTAYSGGLVWVPNNHHMAEVGLRDSRDDALTYLRRISNGKHSEEVLLAFVEKGPEAIPFIEQHANFTFEVVRDYPDYNAELPGGKPEGRYLNAPLFPAKSLGPWQDKFVSSPHFNIPTNFNEVGRWGGRDNVRGWDWKTIGKRMEDDVRGWGAAYSGYLLKACLDHKVKVLLQSRARELVRGQDGRIAGVEVEREGRRQRVQARLGVLLACGGYEWNDEMKQRMPWPHFVANSVPTNTGDGHLMGLKAGAAMAMIAEDMGCAIRVPGEEHYGQPLYRNLTSQAATPGVIAVNKAGKRFCNESFWMSFDAGLAHYDPNTQSFSNRPAFLIFDQWHKDNYPVGTTMPWEEAPSWLTRGATLRELAEKLGIDEAQLEKTVARFNEEARKGVDSEFHRGERAYDRVSGDPHHTPNPCLAPIERPPFYGLEAFYHSNGTRSGLLINGKAQVLDLERKPIPGLHACANVAAHLACGTGYTSGLTLAQSTVMGYCAALDMTR